MSGTIVANLRPTQRNCILEAKVYRKWISKSIPDIRDIAFCCILIDKENNDIQANMDINNIHDFNQLLKLGMVYRISKFLCQEAQFPNNYFEFASHNQLSSRVPYQDENSKMVYPILTGTEVQLSASSASHYYINPIIPKAEQAHATFKEKFKSNHPLQITRHRFEDSEMEKQIN
ncbi:hypothetical protein Tco_0940020 [Tanacetum coccineum]|uniref:Uncharacterized protein n=1 Tax=Tanacetum coccineum TaxID=301880 RepID=A0ABQ5DLS5_9ASTR